MKKINNKDDQMRRFIVSRNNWVNKPIFFIEFYLI